MNVLPWSNHRVRLVVPEDKCDFINASPISVRDSISNQETKYIATQVIFLLLTDRLPNLT